jgi:hypothetical protein
VLRRDERLEQRPEPAARTCSDLRLERGCEEERMLGQLDRLHAVIRCGGADDDTRAFERFDVCRIDPEAAVVEALERLAAANRAKPRPCDRRHEPHLPDEAAGEAADDAIGGVRRGVDLAVRQVPGITITEREDHRIRMSRRRT